MARVDVLVLGAGIVGTSVALHLVRRGLSVALVDRRAPGEETSYGNAGIIEGDTLFPPAFPNSFMGLLRVALKQAPEANYHWNALLEVAPWLLAFRRNSTPERLMDTALTMRPLFARAIAEHEALMAETDATQFLRHTGWLKLFRKEASFAACRRELDLAASLGLPFDILGVDEAQAREPAIAPVFAHAVHWTRVATVTDPLAVTRAYADRFAALGGMLLTADARSLHRSASHWRVETAEGPVDGDQAVVALGPFAPDVLEPLGLRLPFGFKRGYHRHYRQAGGPALGHTLLDADFGYCLAPMAQGVRLTTGAEFARRDAPPTPVQFGRLLPAARELFPLGEPVEAEPWMGRRPCLPDSRPVIGRAPGQAGLWLTVGHAHWGLTLGPATGRLIAEMMAGETPFTDPAPFRAERFAG